MKGQKKEKSETKPNANVLKRNQTTLFHIHVNLVLCILYKLHAKQIKFHFYQSLLVYNYLSVACIVCLKWMTGKYHTLGGGEVLLNVLRCQLTY